MPDRNSGDLRFFNLISFLVERSKVSFIALGEARQAGEIGQALTDHYRDALAASGVEVLQGGPLKALRRQAFGLILFEWYFTATRLIDEARASQPGARIVVDAVDVVFNRMQSKARLSGASADTVKAEAIKAEELAVYANADIVVTVSDSDAQILKRDLPALRSFTVPNIHPMRDLQAVRKPATGRGLIFVGSFTHEPNIDAVRFLCEEILPLITKAEPDVCLRIVGNAPTDDVKRLASPHVEVLGYVPSTVPFLEASAVSVAPLRFGGGMKGKVGEAMAFGVPVVTTGIGVEGFGLTPGEHVLIADDARGFADAVVRLLRDDSLRERVRLAGYHFIGEHYSDIAVRQRVHTLLSNLESYPVQRRTLVGRFVRRARALWARHVGWRFACGPESRTR